MVLGWINLSCARTRNRSEWGTEPLPRSADSRGEGRRGIPLRFPMLIIDPPTVPEPASVALLGGALLGFGAPGRREPAHRTPVAKPGGLWAAEFLRLA